MSGIGKRKSERGGRDSAPAAVPATPEALGELLGHLAACAGVDCEPVDAVRRIRQADALNVSAPSDDRSRLERAAEGVGLRIVTLHASVRQMADAPHDAAAPFVVQAESGEWLALRGRRGRRVRVSLIGPGQDAEWLDPPRLAERIGAPTLDAIVPWHAAAPLAPLAAMSSGEEHGHAVSPLWRLRELLRLDRDDLWVVLIYAVAVGLLSIATPVAVQALVNTVAFGALLQPVFVLTLLLFAVLAFAAVLRTLQVRVVESLQQRLFVRVALDVAHRLPRVPAPALDRVYGPELVNRFFDVLTVQKTAATFLLDGIGLLLQAAIGLLVLAFYHPALLAFDVLLMASVAFVLVRLGRAAPTTSIAESKAKYAVAAWLEEIARHPYVFRARHGVEHATERATELVQRYLSSRREHFRIVVRQVEGLVWLQAIASAALLGIGGALVVSRQLTLGQLVAAEIIVTGVVASLVKLGKHLESFYDLLAAVDKLGHLSDLPLEPVAVPVTFDADPRGARLRVRRASFAYAGGQPGVGEVSFDVEPGSRALVIGKSGTGKTTLAELVFGLRSPTGGSVELDGVDTREAPLAWLRDRAAIVGPSTEVFEGTVADNVAGGRPEVGPREVWKALEAVGLEGVVRQLPDRAGTRLLPTGAPLSYGQARRLAIARAIAARPRLLILDDALSGLDDEARASVERALLDPAAPWTLLAFASSEDGFSARPEWARLVTLEAAPAAGEVAS